MKMEQSFEVQAPLEQVWSALLDLERVAPCLPGAAITGHDEDGTYRGTFSVKLGPMTAAYNGTIKVEEVDEAAHRATLKAKGTDKRGQGGANATIVNTLSRARRRHARRRGDGLHHHRPARPVRPRRDHGGRLQPPAARLRHVSLDAPRRACCSRSAVCGRGDPGGVGAASAAAAAPVKGFSLFVSVVWERVKRLFGGGKG